MLLQVIDLQLLIVAQIAQGQSRLPVELPGYRQLLAKRRRRYEGGGHHVVVIVAQREYLVVRLSVVGAEHDARQRQVQFIAEYEPADVVGGNT